MEQAYKNILNNYREKGTIVLPYDNNIYPISKTDVEELTSCCHEVEKEYIEIGDAGEKNNLLVGRFMTDIEKPQMVNNKYSKQVLDILNSEKMISFSKKILNTQDELYIRRVQFNQIDKDCFVGYHLDTDSNPDYLVAGVIQLGSNYEGGYYRVYQKDKTYFDYETSYGDLILSNCNYPHEVTKVTKGERKSLVFFLSKHNQRNRRVK